MSPETIGIIGICVLIVLLFARMWIGASMALIGFVGYAYIINVKAAFGVVAQIPYNTIAFYPITCLPLFMLMGEVISETKMGEDLYETAHKLIGQVRGGLAMATVVACALFAAITGMSAASTIAMGKVALPQMRKHKYDDSLATGCIASAGTLATLIPPSMTFIMYGILTENSVGLLFMAGFLPGILLAALFILTILTISLIQPEKAPRGPKTSLKEKVVSLKYTWHMILLFLLVLGGIYGGIFTPTEAGAVGAFGAIIITVASRRLNLRRFFTSLLNAGQTTAMAMLLVVGAFIFMKFLAVSKLPFVIADVIGALEVSRYVIFAGIVFMYIILGMFLDVISAVILTIPIIYPLIVALGFDPIWYGVVIVIIIEMGVVTPPIGINVFILAGVVDTPLYTIFRGVTPFVVAMILCIVIITIFPEIALFLPGTM